MNDITKLYNQINEELAERRLYSEQINKMCNLFMTPFLYAIETKGQTILNDSNKGTCGTELHDGIFEIRININEDTEKSDKKHIYYEDGYMYDRDVGVALEAVFFDYVHNAKNTKLIYDIFTKLCNDFKLSLINVARIYDSSEILIVFSINKKAAHSLIQCERYFIKYIDKAYKILSDKMYIDKTYDIIYKSLKDVFQESVKCAITNYAKLVSSGEYDNDGTIKTHFTAILPCISEINRDDVEFKYLYRTLVDYTIIYNRNDNDTVQKKVFNNVLCALCVELDIIFEKFDCVIRKNNNIKLINQYDDCYIAVDFIMKGN